VPVLVDSTFATPILQNPIEQGAAMVLHSATKFLGGYGDVVGGVIATGTEWAAALRRVRVVTGGILHPLAGYLLHRGLATLAVRVRTAQAGARSLAALLGDHPEVARVFYPGLPGADSGGVLGRQMRGPGSLLALELRGGREAAARFMASVRLATPAVSLGSNDTLVQHPAGLTHQVLSAEARSEGGISEGLVRISVGLEDPGDLWRDLRQALDRAHRAGEPREPATVGRSASA
jgi:methionine-gamma-lyase